MLRAQRPKHWRNLCWKNRCKVVANKTSPKRKGRLALKVCSEKYISQFLEFAHSIFFLLLDVYGN